MTSDKLVHDWIAIRLSLGLDFQLEGGSPSPNSIVFKNAQMITQWSKVHGQHCLFAGLTPLKRPVGGHSYQVSLSFCPPHDCHGKVLYFLKMINPLAPELLSMNDHVFCGEFSENAVQDLRDHIQNFVLPHTQVWCFGWHLI